MLREAKKNEITESEKRSFVEMLLSFNDGNLPGDERYEESRISITWVAGTYKNNKTGKIKVTGHWSLQYHFIGQEKPEELFDLMICSECKKIYPVTAGNCYDGIERCENCHAQTY